MDRQEEQLTLWEYIYERKQIKKKVRLIELFAGIGAQAKALEILKVPFEHYKICEWAYNSYKAYNSIHIKDFKDYSEGKAKEELIERIKGTSTNYNDPLALKQLEKKPIEWLKSAYNNCEATHNLINIMEVHGDDLQIVDTKNYEYIMTYSFPCQDLSLAGKGKGMSVSQKEGGTRSGLLWEVERILDELYEESREREESTLPQVLLMENVPEVIGTKNIKDFKKWEEKLRKLGYTNYVEILNAKNYGIPQNRRRCFMISILGEYAYDFPRKFHLKYKLKDLLESNVPEKYYLSKKMLNCFLSDGTGNFPRKERFLQNLNRPNQDVGNAFTTLAGGRPTDNFVGEEPNDEIIKLGSYNPSGFASGVVVVPEGIAPAVLENHGTVTAIPIKNATKQGYLEAEEGDGVDISSRMETHRGTVQKGMAQTITTMGGENVGVVVKKNLRIRKLTPKECMRLMGFEDKDHKALIEIGLSDAAIYHCAGDSIVTTCLVSILWPLFGLEKSHLEIIEEYVKNHIIEKGEGEK